MTQLVFRTVGLASLTFALTLSLPPTTSRAALQFTGVNLSGAEFGISNNNVNLPGTPGTTYEYPTTSEVDYFTSKGMNIFRMPFRWERLQPTPDSAFNSAEQARMDAFVNYATSKGADVIIDPHNFERYYPTASNFQSAAGGLIGGSTANSQGTVVTNAMFDDFWSRLAQHYAGNSHVIFGLMNEPNAVPEQQLVGTMNSAISAIRATGATNEILVPGNSFTGAWTWNNDNTAGDDTSSNANAMLQITDPDNNFAIEVHQYFDSDGSGTHTSLGGKVNPSNATNDPNTAMLGVDRLTAFTNWLKANNLKGFLGEFAVDKSQLTTSTSTGTQLLDNMMNYMQANSDVWQGWTFWGGGPFWANNSTFHIDPVNGVDQPTMLALEPFLAPEPSSVALIGAGFLWVGLKRRTRAN